MWPDQRLIVELDTLDYHGHEAAFERDRDKRLNTTPDREAARLRALLATR